MGDRANIVIVEGDDPPLFLYTHWGGTELPEDLRTALSSPAGRSRWKDAPYLARIIFCRMILGMEDAETGFGIATSPPDNEHHWLVVRPDAETVEERLADDPPQAAPLVRSWTFEEYCAQSTATWTEVSE